MAVLGLPVILFGLILTRALVLWQPFAGFVSKELGQGTLINVEAGKTTDVGQIKLDPSKVRIDPSKIQGSL